jgi:hypothetical protein
MKITLYVTVVSVFLTALSSDVHAQAFPNDNDGLLDVGEAPGFPSVPADAEGSLSLYYEGIELSRIGTADINIQVVLGTKLQVVTKRVRPNHCESSRASVDQAAIHRGIDEIDVAVIS